MGLRDELIKSGMDGDIKNGNSLKGRLGNISNEGKFVNINEPSTYIEVRLDKDFSLDYFGGKNGEEHLLYSESDSSSKKDLNNFIKENFSNSEYVEWSQEIESIFPYDSVISDYIENDSLFENRDLNNSIDMAAETEQSMVEKESDSERDNIEEAVRPLSPEEADRRDELQKDIELENVQDGVVDENDDEVPDVDESYIENITNDEKNEAEPYISPSSLIDIKNEYNTMLDVGYIAPAVDDEIRKDIIQIREQNPNVGKMFSGIVDTSSIYRFNHKDLTTEKLSPYLSEDIKSNGVSFINVSQTIGTDKEFLYRFKENIDGNKMYGTYCPISIVTFEYRLKGENSNRLDVYAVNDLGKVYGRIDAVSDKEHIVLGKETDTLGFLDMTSTDSIRKFSFMKNDTDGISSNSLDKLKAVLSEENDGLLDKMSDRIADNLLSDAISGGYSALYEKMSDIENNIELFRDNSDFIKMRSDVEISHKIEKLDSVGKQIVDTIKEIDKNKENPVNNTELSAKLDALKADYEVKIAEIKEFAHSPERQELVEANKDNKDCFEKASFVRQDFELKIEGLYNTDGKLRVNDTGNSENRFVELIKKETVSSPLNTDIPAVNDKFNTTAINAKKEFVDTWNKMDGNENKQLHVKENTGEIYTEYGTRVDRKSAFSETKDEYGRSDYKIYFDPGESRYSTTELGKMGLAEGRHGVDLKSESYQEFLSFKLDDETAIGDISIQFYETARDGISQRDIDNLEGDIEHIDNRLSASLEREGMQDIEEAREIIDVSAAQKADDSEDKGNVVKKAVETGTVGREIKTDVSGDPEADSPKTKYISKIGNPDASVELSDKKMAEIEKNSDSLKNKEIENAKNILSEIKTKIEACDRALSSFEGKTEYFLMNSPAYQYANMQINEYIKDYEKAGGKIGEGCFLKSGVSQLESVATNISYLNALSHNGIGGILGLIVTEVQIKHAFKADMKAAIGNDMEKISIKDKISGVIDKVVDTISEISFDDTDFTNNIEDDGAQDLDRSEYDSSKNIEETENEDIDDSNMKNNDIDSSDSENIPIEESNEKPEDLDVSENDTHETDNSNISEEIDSSEIESADENITTSETEDFNEDTDSDDQTYDFKQDNNVEDKEENDKISAAISDDFDVVESHPSESDDITVHREDKDNLSYTEKSDDADKTNVDDKDLEGKIKDSFDGDKEDFEEVINDALQDEKLTPEDLIDQFSDVLTGYISENISDAEYIDESSINGDGMPEINNEDIMDIGEKINIVADSISNDTGINADGIRDSILSDIKATDSISDNIANAIDYAIAQNSIDAEPTTIEALSYGDIDIDELQSIQNSEDYEPAINDIESGLNNRISTDDFTGEIEAGVDMTQIADIIKDQVSENVDIPESSVNNLVEQRIADDAENGVFNNPSFDMESYIDSSVAAVTDQVVNYDPAQSVDISSDAVDSLAALL